MAVAYGETYIETAHDKLCDLLDALVVTMATGYDPKVSYVYRKHATANLLTNAATCEFMGGERSDEGTTNVKSRFLLEFGVRVHTDYLPSPKRDGQKSMRLLNSVINKLQINLDLDGGYRLHQIRNIENAVDFEDSQTFGGRFVVVVMVDVEFTQE